MSFWGWCLTLLFIVGGLVGIVYVLWQVAKVSLLFLLEAWENRSGLNPLTSQGRWRLLGIICLGLSITAFIYFMESLRSWSGSPILVFALLIGIVGMRSLGRAKRFEVTAGDKVLEEDERPPVVYLRSFKDDSRAAHRVSMAGMRVTTEEGELADLVKDIGPLVAIGQPGEELPFFGAARVYAGHDDWQQRVRQLLSTAPIVILRAGSTAGLWWEVEQCARNVMPQRLVVLVPLNRSGYEDFRRKAQEFFPCRLPDYNGRYIGATTLRAVLYFDDDWTPHMEPVLKRGYTSYFIDKATEQGDIFTKEKSDMRKIFEDVLDPVLKRAS